MYISLYDFSDSFMARTCHGFSITQKIMDFLKIPYLLVYFIRLKNKCAVKCRTIRYVYWYLQNNHTYSTFNITEIYNKVEQCNLQPFLYEGCYNYLAMEITIFSYCPTHLDECHPFI